MPAYRSASVTRLVGWIAPAFFLLAITTHTVSGQRAPGPPPVESPDPFAEMRERRQRETMLRSTELRLGGAAKEEKGVDTSLAQANQDFNRIQILHNEIVHRIAGGGTLDYKAMSDTAAEINKRANRLKKFLVPESLARDEDREKERIELNGGQLKVALVVLCQRIESFVENPLFNAPGTVDVEQSAKAGADLLRIIELSDNVKKDAGRLSKTLK